MNKKLTKIVKKIGLKIRTHVLEAPHPTLVAFGVSAAITIALAVGISMMTADHSHLAYAKIKEHEPT
jgi:pantoate kinase